MSKFKVGDRVVRTGTYTITLPEGYEIETKKPVEEMNLDELIECANRGADASEHLENTRKYRNDYIKKKYTYSSVSHNHIYKYKKAPQKTFEPYTINSTGWGVRVPHNERLRYGSEADNKVVIGCKTFNAKDLLAALRALIVEEEPYTYLGITETKLYATMRGARYKGHVLPWDDAKELMKKLEAYLEEK